MQKNQPRTMVKKRRDGGIMVWSPRGARAGRRERNTAFYWSESQLVALYFWSFNSQWLNFGVDFTASEKVPPLGVVHQSWSEYHLVCSSLFSIV